MQNYHCSYVDSDKALVLAVQELQQENLIAIDTEFCRQSTYFPILSTIQVACFGEKSFDNLPRIFIIDCLAISSISPFFALLESQKIIKVFHSALQDLQILLRARSNSSNCSENPAISSNSPESNKSKLKAVFDTQIMANLCSPDFNIGYGNLVEKLFSHKLCKEHQLSDWQLRPLSQNQINYAANDVLYLAKIFEYFHEKITSSSRNDWLDEEMNYLIERSCSSNLDGLLKKFDLTNKTQKEAELLRQLVISRENMAQKLDIPRQHVVRDDVLEEIVAKKALPQSLAKRIKSEFLERVLEILQNFLSDKSNENDCLQPFISKSISQKELIQKTTKKIQNLVRDMAQNCAISEQFLLSKSTILKIIEQKNCRNSLAKWRYELLGSEIESILSKLDT